MKIFPYQRDYTGELFPVVELFVIHKTLASKTLALIDSGATISIFREDVAKELNIKIENGKEIYLGGVGGRIKGFIHQLKVEVAGETFVCPVVFSYEYLVSFNLLGRDGFFKRFKITFDEKKNQVKVE